MSVIERMKQIVDYKGISKRTFYKQVGLSNGYLDKEREVGHKKIEQICTVYPEISIEWLVTGKGKIEKNSVTSVDEIKVLNALEIKEKRKKLGLTQLELAELIGVSKNTVLNYEKGSVIPESKITILNKTLNNLEPKNKTSNVNAIEIHPEFVYVPLVSEFAQAGYLGGYGDVEYIEALPKIGFVINPQDRGNFLCFEVRGDSMDDNTRKSLIEKDIVLGREISSDLWTSKLINTTYIIVHRTEGVLIKKLKSHDPKSGVVVLESLNPFYEDLEINLKNVSQLFKTSTIIRRS